LKKKREELLRRLKEGIPIDEVPRLLEEVQREEALEKAPKENLSHFEDEKMQYFSDLWFSQRKTASVEQKNQVGLAYISKTLGLEDEIAQKFAQGDREAYHSVGMAQSAMSGCNLISFWSRVSQIFPNIYDHTDIRYLDSQGIGAVFHFKWQLEVLFAEDSPILCSLAVNAHAYK